MLFIAVKYMLFRLSIPSWILSRVGLRLAFYFASFLSIPSWILSSKVIRMVDIVGRYSQFLPGYFLKAYIDVI